MSVWMLVDLAGGAGYVGAAVAATLFVVRYGWWSAWRATLSGRVLFGVMATIATILDLSLLSRWWWMPPDRVAAVLWAALFLALAGGFVHLDVILWRAQRRDRQMVKEE